MVHGERGASEYLQRTHSKRTRYSNLFIYAVQQTRGTVFHSISKHREDFGGEIKHF